MEREKPGEAGRTLTAAYLALLFFGLPLTMHNGYFDITETKHLYFLLVSGSYVLAMGILLLAGGRRGRTGTGRGLSITDGCMLAFFGAFLVASLLSGRLEEAVMGRYNRYQGLLTAALYAAVYFCVTRHYAFPWWDGAALVAGFCAVCLLAALNDFSLDPLGAFANLRPMDQHRYLSTLGNINFYGGYLSVLYPVILTRWCFATERWETWLYGFGVVCGALGTAPSGSDSLGLALLTAVALLPLFCLGNVAALRRLLLSVLLFLAAAQLYGLASRLWGTRFYPPFFLRLLQKPPVAAALFALCGAFLLLLRRRTDGQTARWKKPYGIALAVLFLACCLFLLLANTALSDHSFGVFDRFLKLNEHWGTDRGKIWAYCLGLYGDFTPAQKLFGAGPGCLYALDVGRPLFPDAVLDSAHNEYLHYLLTLGLFGLAAYAGLLLSATAAALRSKNRNPASLGFRRLSKKPKGVRGSQSPEAMLRLRRLCRWNGSPHVGGFFVHFDDRAACGAVKMRLSCGKTEFFHSRRNPASLGFLLGVLCYAAQALVSIAQPVSTPFLFVLLALSLGSHRQIAHPD